MDRKSVGVLFIWRQLSCLIHSHSAGSALGNREKHKGNRVKSVYRSKQTSPSSFPGHASLSHPSLDWFGGDSQGDDLASQSGTGH